jgi:predicted Zn-dependent peptidase
MSYIRCRQLACGATLVTERIENVQSAAMNWLLPIGSAVDPPDGDGWSALLAELIFRGAGDLDSRQHSDALDRLGMQRSSDVFTHHLRIKATILGEKLPEALPLIAAMVRQPAMRADSLEPVRRLCISTLESLADDPQHFVMLQLRQRHHPPPLNRHGHGVHEVLAHATIDELRTHWQSRCVPQGTIIAAAGSVDSDALADQLNRLLEGWSGEAFEPTPSNHAARGYLHTPQETAQVHLAAAYNAPPEPDPSSVLERIGTTVLSGSTSARLFTEVRQKRSLCYSVGASYRAESRPRHGVDVCRHHAGTGAGDAGCFAR